MKVNNFKFEKILKENISKKIREYGEHPGERHPDSDYLDDYEEDDENYPTPYDDEGIPLRTTSEEFEGEQEKIKSIIRTRLKPNTIQHFDKLLETDPEFEEAVHQYLLSYFEDPDVAEFADDYLKFVSIQILMGGNDTVKEESDQPTVYLSTEDKERIRSLFFYTIYPAIMEDIVMPAADNIEDEDLQDRAEEELKEQAYEYLKKLLSYSDER